jgi:hypothetical protein
MNVLQWELGAVETRTWLKIHATGPTGRVRLPFLSTKLRATRAAGT